MVSKKLKSFFCAFCRTPRTLRTQKHIGLFEVGLSLLASLCITFFFYQSLDFKFFPIFCIFMVASEIIIQLSRRFSVACPHCGFDPVIYKLSPEKAASVVKAYMEARKKDPLVLFTKTPTLKLPTRTKFQELKNQKLAQQNTKAVARKSPAHKAKNLDLSL